jgi:hypothetical protein
MKINKLGIFGALMLVAFTVCNGFSQLQDDKILHTRIVNLAIDKMHLSSALREISKTYEIPIGLELTAQSYNERNMIKLDIVDSSLEEVLGLILEQDSNYKMEVNQGVINFVPIKHRSAVLRDLMRTNIEKFDPNPRSTLVHINHYMARLPEVESMFTNVNPFRFMIYDSLPSISRLPILITRPLYNTDYRTILNETVKINSSKFWVAVEWNEDFISIVF